MESRAAHSRHWSVVVAFALGRRMALAQAPSQRRQPYGRHDRQLPAWGGRGRPRLSLADAPLSMGAASDATAFHCGHYIFHHHYYRGRARQLVEDWPVALRRIRVAQWRRLLLWLL